MADVETLLSTSDRIPIPVSYTPQQVARVVTTPAGKCPISLTNLWTLPSCPPDSVICDWFWQVRNYGLAAERMEFMTAEAIAYWAGELTPALSDDDHRRISETILNYARQINDYLAPARPMDE